MNSAPLVSRRRHYFYVLVSSVAAWLLFVEMTAGFIPNFYFWGGCHCGVHNRHVNISWLLFGFGGFISGVVFSYPLHRLMWVWKANKNDFELPITFLAGIGKRLLGLYGLLFLVLISGLYLATNHVRWTFFHSVYEKNYTDLHCAAACGKLTWVISELKWGADPTALDGSGRTPLHLAANFGHYDTVKLLIEKGAPLNVRDTLNGNTPLNTATPHQYRVFVLLIENGADVTLANEYGTTPLHHAVAHQKIELITMIINNGADVNAIDNDGDTPLGWAINGNNIEIIEFLRTHGGKTGDELRAEQEKK